MSFQEIWPLDKKKNKTKKNRVLEKVLEETLEKLIEQKMQKFINQTEQQRGSNKI